MFSIKKDKYIYERTKHPCLILYRNSLHVLKRKKLSFRIKNEHESDKLEKAGSSTRVPRVLEKNLKIFF